MPNFPDCFIIDVYLGGKLETARTISFCLNSGNSNAPL